MSDSFARTTSDQPHYRVLRRLINRQSSTSLFIWGKLYQWRPGTKSSPAPGKSLAGLGKGRPAWLQQRPAVGESHPQQGPVPRARSERGEKEPPPHPRPLQGLRPEEQTSGFWGRGNCSFSLAVLKKGKLSQHRPISRKGNTEAGYSHLLASPEALLVLPLKSARRTAFSKSPSALPLGATHSPTPLKKGQPHF